MLNSPWSLLKKNDCLGPNFYLDLHRKFSGSCSINSVCLNVAYVCACICLSVHTRVCTCGWRCSSSVMFHLIFFPFFHSLIVSYLCIINFSHFFPTYFCQAPHLLLNTFPFPTSLPLMLMSSFSVGSTEHNYNRLHKHGPEVICWSMATLLFQPGSVTEPGPYQLARLSASKLQGSTCPHSLTFQFSVLGFTNSCFCTQLFM